MGEKTEKKSGKTDAMRRQREEAYARSREAPKAPPENALELGQTPKASGKGGNAAVKRRGSKG